MTDTYFTFPGKLGDAIHQWPIAYWWARENQKKFHVWLDENTCKPLVPLLEAQSCVESVELKGGIENYNCGGQPWHFGMDTKDFAGKIVHHMGLRGFPQRQLTLEAWNHAKIRLSVSQAEMAEAVCFEVGEVEHKNRLVLHGQPIYAHTKSTPSFWRFLHSVKSELESLFDEIVFVGTARDMEIGQRTYPEWLTYGDEGSFLNLARYLAGSRCCIGVGSSVVTLAGAMQVPTIRVHDQIADKSRLIWDNLSPKSLNRTEAELRNDWPKFRDEYLGARDSVGATT